MDRRRRTEEHGDLLDLIRLNRELPGLREAMDEARHFLALPRHEQNRQANPAPSNSPNAARRLFGAGRPIPGTQAEAYLRARGITGRLDWVALRFHPRVWYRETHTAPLEAWPALLAAVTDPGGRIPASSAPGLIEADPTRRRSPIRAALSATCSAMVCVSGQPGCPRAGGGPCRR